MVSFSTKRLPVAPDAIAPDGSDVRLLLGFEEGGLAHFELRPGDVSIAVAHHTVEEIWFFLSGRGEMWRKDAAGREETVSVDAGVALTIPVGTRFQFRSFGHEPLEAVGVTMPAWPGDGEAYVVDGKWEPKNQRGSNSEQTMTSEQTTTSRNWYKGEPIVRKGEVIREVVTAADHVGFGYAVAEITRSACHHHPTMLETYHLISGVARVHLDDREVRLDKPGQTLEIRPGVRHWVEAVGEQPARISVHCFPAWTAEENITDEEL